MNPSQEQLINRKMAGLGGIVPAMQQQVGDAFNLKNLATLLVKLETDDEMSPQLLEATEYAQFVPVKLNFPAVLGTSHELKRKMGVGEGQDHSGTGGDIPLAEVDYDSITLPTRMGSIGYQYSIHEMATASQAGINLSGDKVQAARLAYEKHMSNIAWLGNPAVGVQGLINQTKVTVVTAALAWETATPDQVLEDFNNILSGAIESCEFNASITPDTVVFPTSLMKILTSRRIAENLETTLFEWISKNNLLALEGKPLTIRGKSRLEKAGDKSRRRILVYRRDPDCIEMRIPQDLQFLAAQATNFDIFTPGHYLYQGVWLKRIDSLRYLDVPEIGSAPAWTLTITATGGNFTFTDGIKTSTNVAYSANAAAIQTKLQEVISDAVVTGTGPFTITLPVADVLTVNVGSLTGGTATLVVAAPVG